MPATLSDVAREVGVAPSTVADILRGRKGYSEKTRERTLAAANKLDFVPNYFARSLQKQRSTTIGVLSDLSKTDMTGSMVNAITHGLIAKGFMLWNPPYRAHPELEYVSIDDFAEAL